MKGRRGCVVLAGGSSSRFHGLDKALLDLGNGRTLLEEVAARLEFLDEVVISTSSAERAHRYHRLTGLNAVVDEYQGILGGVLAGCRALDCREVLVVGVDMPFLKREVIDCEFAAMRGYQAVVPTHPNGFLEPLHSILSRTPALGPLEAICRSGVRRVSRLFETLNTYYMPVEAIRLIDPRLDCFTNVNDERSLGSVLARLAGGPPQARNSRSSSSGSARALTSSLERD